MYQHFPAAFVELRCSDKDTLLERYRMLVAWVNRNTINWFKVLR
jgi:hypothetical protein